MGSRLGASPGPLCSRLIDLCRERAEQLPAEAAAISAIADALGGPLRVAMAGRVSSGKSTIVNALVGQRVAATDVGECTRIPTWFHFGAHEHATLTRADGTSTGLQLTADGALPASLPEDPDGVARIDVWLSSAALDAITVVDTPGLSSLSGASERTHELLAMDLHSRAAISQTDALLFVMPGELHKDDADVLEAFRTLMAGTHASTVNAIGVLNKIDLIGGGSPDAIGTGRERAGKLARTLRTSVAAVLPMVGLQAETTETGALSMGLTRALVQLSALDEMERQLLLLSVDRFTSGDCEVPVPVRKELVARLDITGIRDALATISGGGDIDEVLSRMRDNSGIGGLKSALEELFVSRADALKAEWAIAALRRSGDGVITGPMAARLEEIEVDPAMHALQELRALQQATARDIAIPETLLDEVRRLVAGSTLRSRLGLDAAASSSECRQAASEGSSRWAEWANGGSGGPSGRRVAAIIRRSYDLMWQEAVSAGAGA